MASRMEYQGYVGVFEFDEVRGIFHGHVMNTRDVVTFEGRSVQELQWALAGAIDTYRGLCAQDGVAPERPRLDR